MSHSAIHLMCGLTYGTNINCEMACHLLWAQCSYENVKVVKVKHKVQWLVFTYLLPAHRNLRQDRNAHLIFCRYNTFFSTKPFHLCAYVEDGVLYCVLRALAEVGLLVLISVMEGLDGGVQTTTPESALSCLHMEVLEAMRKQCTGFLHKLLSTLPTASSLTAV